MSSLVSQEQIKAISSLEVAEMCETRHSDLLEKIRGYCVVLAERNFPLGSFFLESTYIDKQNQERPCYLLTRKGCDMVANKMTGEKGIVFTAKYVTKFEEMEQQLKQPMCLEDLIIANAKALKDAREQAEKAQATALEVKQEVQAIRDTITLDPAAWRTETTNLVNRIAQKLGGNENIQVIRKESYDLLDSRAKAKLGIRQTNMKRKVLEETGSTSKSNKITKLDVIAADARLREVYIAIVKEMAIKYGVA
ncbi:Rha family transcriptional regulator [Sporanaerobium hydrogeniformans]|uniref:Rha family transcriptional regulator n=1 Tax=Sporanaerobium hydrogeniformans TaxID=3072179 RepID=A0AC61DKD6_9FIRM|nr:Rha family transcriptional regulator [Sporanaerobium hydrogeniformans]PHV72152.1 Rha family transcriptional regulator [Sporanaerobium hydrogeniformans]